ncbi:MAG TPA: L-threonylcarbamoyladenylate synthase [Rhodopila sp.]|nr:L-threonylcarbamoyladenylate synthase [Rhodopila sp.]
MTDILQANSRGVARAAALLRAGALVAFGTETVYGLGGIATNPDAVASIFAAKGRPRFNPLICHYPSAGAALAHVVADERVRNLASHFWPGPLTLVLPRAMDCPAALLVSAGLDTLAIRVPGHPVARALLHQVGMPVAAPSANRSGRVSPTTARHVSQELAGRIEAVLDSGTCHVGIESTVVDLTGHEPILLRPGGVTVEALEDKLGPIMHRTRLTLDEAPHAPGMLASHYAPSLPVRLQATTVAADEALLAFGPPLDSSLCVFQLSLRGHPVEAAARLFEGLRWLDAEGSRLGARGIAVMPISEGGIGLAINDRLQRAAAPRP